jgi:hypothetical protein
VMVLRRPNTGDIPLVDTLMRRRGAVATRSEDVPA